MNYRLNNSFLSYSSHDGEKQVENIKAKDGQEGQKEFDKMFSYS